uniref:Phosphoglucosamine mutase (GlmM) n=1 Tax=uncultured marine group II/III euryarchaeote KM3_13_G01 TaxID=1457873 RepID=A0A075GCD0_9EURY|nr:phosphoglucosamine mutase (glmM) [uncultured marine group II/III euryarchaeote KM3_13_G01]
MAGERLHGTDGIRGKIGSCGAGESPIGKLIFQREISAELFALVGQATGSVLVEQVAGMARPDFYSPLVVIGWDRRDGNEALVSALEAGLLHAGCRVQRVGEVPTPGLHHCILLLEADAGMMVTASHNPATDSGVKLFDGEGYKSMPELEDLISSKIWELDGEAEASENDSATRKGEGDVDAAPNLLEKELEQIPPFDGLVAYRDHLASWLDTVCDLLEVAPEQWPQAVAEQGLLLDSSGGIATDWLSFGLTRRGLLCDEVSSRDNPINKDCGAGEFNPTDSWSNQELAGKQSHALLQALGDQIRNNDGNPPWNDGELVAAALDGDGDRCLLIEATNGGVQIVDGDQMAYDWMQARSTGQPQRLAHSIESDLCLPAACRTLGAESIQNAVGDRWLSNSLNPSDDGKSRLIFDDSMPLLFGCEDSGHLVMPTQHPLKPNHWSLAGDGAASLVSQLCARLALGPSRKTLERGWKGRVSVNGVDRSRWNGQNELASKVVEIVDQNLSEANLKNVEIEGETSLLLLEGTLDGEAISIGIRNSGTEAKTSVSMRSSSQNNVESLTELMNQLGDFLSDKLIP